MNFSVERPYAFYALFLLVPAILVIIFQYRKISKKFGFFQTNYSLKGSNDLEKKHFPRVIILRTVFRSLSWLMIVCAYAGFSWGTYLEPVQKNGNAVSLVFDISFSMMARDCPNEKSRLESVVNYAKLLLENMEEQNVSVILAKGEGLVALPLTEDRESVESLLDSLSPYMMTSIGTSLGNGILAALKKFPQTSSLNNRIWVFTDGEETDGKLESALEESVKYGTDVFLIGFGSEIEIPVLAGDGKTEIYTALRSENLEKISRNVLLKNQKNKNSAKIEFIDSTEPGSAVKLLKPLKNSQKKSLSQQKDEEICYEVKTVKRYWLFIALAIIFFVLSFVFSEFNSGFFKRKKIVLSSVLFCIFFTSCSQKFDGGKKILSGSWAWAQNKYSKAVSEFFKVVEDSKESEDSELYYCALYNLSVTYYSQNETAASMERFKMIYADAPEEIKFDSFYNMGVISHQSGNYEKACDYFKKALEIKSENTDAKINYEISMLKLQNQGKEKEKIYKNISETNAENSVKDSSVFSVIRERERQQWKNSNSVQEGNLSQDY